MLIDTHCHLNSEYYSNIKEVLDKAHKNGVDVIIVSGCEKQMINEVIEISNKYNNVYITLGFHPSECHKVTDKDIADLERLFKLKKFVGIGEIGLDYFYDNSEEEKDLQKKLFIKQLDLAKKYNFPVVIHSRDATSDTLEILKKYRLHGIIHCFSSSYEVAFEYINLGYYIGVGGVLTFKNSKLKNVIKKIPLKNIVIETDSPYLSPEPYRGTKNDPSNILIIASKMAEIKDCSLECVKKQTTKNALKLFDIII